ncbi:CRISPR-associated endonuclease Cas2 [Eubacterium sp. MSJ-33]|nr:CRISPR-associated endonuclease Cas2 [Eubacterium sp. MSJ-33]
MYEDGYGNMIPIAPEVFMRIVTNRKASEKHYRRIEQFAPKTGTVRLLRLTEKQYQNIYMVSAKLIIKEKQLVVTVILCYNLI